MMYQSSKGPVEIDTMPLSYALNAMKKLQRTEPERVAEIEALKAHTDRLSAEAEAKALNPQPREAVIGDNGGPALDVLAAKPGDRAAIEAHVDDLLTEAGNWADGIAIETEGQAAEVAKLHRSLQEAAALVRDRATTEKKPHNEAIAEIQAWQNGYVAKGLKGTPDGKLTKAEAATGRLSAAWLQKAEDERKAREAETAAAALAAAQAAMALRAEAKETTDIAVMDRAEDALADAEALLREAKGVAKEKVRVESGEGHRAITLRSVWRAEVTNYGEAYGHYRTIPEFMAEFHGLIAKWATADARTEAGRAKRVPGVNFIEEKVV
ncbi:hypothetical protein [Novosphingobium colocasiae]|uniref:hypothetical protein n=1 Tax=Novosphingobium colocasiae TaxID=1256513 RepID=UPI0035B2E79B